MTENESLGEGGGFVRTPTADAIWTLLDRCYEHGHAGLVLGWPGVGKTTTLGEYAAARPRVLAFRATYAGRTKLGLMTDLCDVLGIPTGDQPRVNNLYRAVLRSLREPEPAMYRQEPPPRLLAIDEANHLSDHGLEIVRDLYDQAGIGLVLLGNVELHIRLKRGANRWTSGYLPLLSRITGRLDLEAVTREDLAVFARHHGVSGTAETFLVKVARRGGLRVVNAVLAQARALAGGSPLALAHLKDAAAIIGTLGGEG
jgi:DNA transposition AAA+ family ATPase